MRSEIRKNGMIIGFTEKNGSRTIVRDENSIIRGWTENGYTRDANGRIVVEGEVPGILL